MIKTHFAPRVYTAVMPNNLKFDRVFPIDRQKEIDSVNNPRLKAQKFWVWKLLEYAIFHSFGWEIADIEFTKKENGKWETPAFNFSLSHSENLLAVAISREPVGVDVEKIASVNRRAIEKTLTDLEKQKYSQVGQQNADEYLLGCWSKKESAFKMSEQEKFLPSKIHGDRYCRLEQVITLMDEKYILTACSESENSLEIFEWVVLDE